MASSFRRRMALWTSLEPLNALPHLEELSGVLFNPSFAMSVLSFKRKRASSASVQRFWYLPDFSKATVEGYQDKRPV